MATVIMAMARTIVGAIIQAVVEIIVTAVIAIHVVFKTDSIFKCVYYYI